MTTSLVLAAHGAGNGSAANALVRWHAARLARRGRFREVRAAFHQGTPSFDQVLGELDARRVVVVPCFTSAGYYSTRVLPDALARGRRAGTAVHITPPLGADPALARLVARAARPAVGRRPRGTTGLLVVGHGTSRHPDSGTTAGQLARALAQQLAVPAVTAFLDQAPAVEAVAATVPWDHVVVVPFLIGYGEHERVDLPVRLRAVMGGECLRLLPPIGRLPGLTDVLQRLALRGAGSGRDSLSGSGRVALVGAGPGDAGLITVRGRDLLAAADVVVHDRLVAPDLLEIAPARARRVNVGKAPGQLRIHQSAINALLIREARAGRLVVRLKGGDPFVFGRGAEEAEACRAAGVPCEVVPGVTSAFGVPAAAGIPVTLRGVSRSVAVVTGRAGDGDTLPFDAPAVAGLDTIVVLMGHAELSRIAGQMIAAGRGGATPVACIQDGATPKQRVVTGTLETIAEQVHRAALRPPVVTVIGDVAARAYATPASRAIRSIASSTVRE